LLSTIQLCTSLILPSPRLRTPPLFPYTTLFRSVHTVVRTSDKNALPPKLLTRRTGPDTVILVYDSLRKMCALAIGIGRGLARHLDRKSTRLNSSHRTRSYAVFCLKKKSMSTH